MKIDQHDLATVGSTTFARVEVELPSGDWFTCPLVRRLPEFVALLVDFEGKRFALTHEVRIGAGDTVSGAFAGTLDHADPVARQLLRAAGIRVGDLIPVAEGKLAAPHYSDERTSYFFAPYLAHAKQRDAPSTRWYRFEQLPRVIREAQDSKTLLLLHALQSRLDHAREARFRADALPALIGERRLPDTSGLAVPGVALSPELLERLAPLVVCSGRDTTAEEVWFAWTAWLLEENPHDPLPAPFGELPEDDRQVVEQTASAIRSLAERGA